MKFNLNIKQKILIVALIPFCGLFYFSVSEIFNKLEIVNESKKTDELIQFATKISSLAHEIQKERGLSAAFLRGGEGGNKFKDSLLAQMGSVNQKRQELDGFSNTINPLSFGKDVKKEYDEMFSALDKIEGYRAKIFSFSVSPENAIEFYSSIIDSSLHIIQHVSFASFNSEISPLVTLYTNFLEEKENAGIERARGAVALVRNKFENGQYEKFIASVVSQENSRRAYSHQVAILGFSDYFREKTVDPVFAETLAMRNTLIEKHSVGNFGLDSEVWFNKMTTKIDILKEIEKMLADSLISKTLIIKEHAQKGIQISLLAIALLLFVILASTLSIVVSIVTPIKKIQDGVREITDGNMDTRIEIKGSDELSELANSFNQMTAALKKSKSEILFYSENLEKRVKDKTKELDAKLSELETFNKLLVGRELKMMDLKKEVENLKTQHPPIA